MAKRPGRGVVRNSQALADMLADEAFARADAVWVITTRCSGGKDDQPEYGIARRGHPDLLAALLDHADAELCGEIEDAEAEVEDDEE